MLVCHHRIPCPLIVLGLPDTVSDSLYQALTKSSFGSVEHGGRWGHVCKVGPRSPCEVALVCKSCMLIAVSMHVVGLDA